MLSVAKAHAYGNDFLFVPKDQARHTPPSDLARRLCDRHRGVGGDGLILYTAEANGAATMRLYNADGSDSELSGNGLRCLAALVLHQRRGQAELDPIMNVHVATDAGPKDLVLVAQAGTRYTFRAAMGPPAAIQRETLTVADTPLPVTILTMGNPQCVALVDQLPDAERFHQLGPALSTHPRFAHGTNVEFAVVEAPDRVRILIWERGVGPTHASGTGACAAAVAAAIGGGAARDVTVIAPGGAQRVEWLDEGVFLTGWAEVLFEGDWTCHAHGASSEPDI